jgi:hypothetical protein
VPRPSVNWSLTSGELSWLSRYLEENIADPTQNLDPLLNTVLVFARTAKSGSSSLAYKAPFRHLEEWVRRAAFRMHKSWSGVQLDPLPLPASCKALVGGTMALMQISFSSNKVLATVVPPLLHML